jgi:hypothetical protein
MKKSTLIHHKTRNCAMRHGRRQRWHANGLDSIEALAAPKHADGRGNLHYFHIKLYYILNDSVLKVCFSFYLTDIGLFPSLPRIADCRRTISNRIFLTRLRLSAPFVHAPKVQCLFHDISPIDCCQYDILRTDRRISRLPGT